jgi:hypothetical protein
VTPTRVAPAKPMMTRISVAMMPSTRCRCTSSSVAPNTSPGLGSFDGEMARASGVSPAVNRYQTISTTRTQPRPITLPSHGGGSWRSVAYQGGGAGTSAAAVPDGGGDAFPSAVSVIAPRPDTP